MNQNFLKSLIFHLIIAILLVVSTWSIFSRHIEPLNEIPITVSLAPIGEKTNIKPPPKQQTKIPQPKKADPKPEPKKPEPKKPEPKKPEPKKPDPKKVEPKKPEKQKDDLDKMLEKMDKEKDKDKEKEKDPDDLKELLKDLDNKKAPEKSSDQPNNTKENSKSDQPFDPNSPEAISIRDAIGKMVTDQLQVCWSPPMGNVKVAIVKVDIDIAQDGTVKFAGFASASAEGTPSGDSAKRAVLDQECNPLHQLPPADKYNIWKEMRITFDPNHQGN